MAANRSPAGDRLHAAAIRILHAIDPKPDGRPASQAERDAAFREARAELDDYGRSQTDRGYADDLAASIAHTLEWAEDPDESRTTLEYFLLVQSCEEYRDDERPAFDADAEDVFRRAFSAAFHPSIDLAFEGDRLLRAAIVLDDHVTGYHSCIGGLSLLDERAVRDGMTGLRRLGLVDAAEIVAAALGADDDVLQELTSRYFEAIGRGVEDAFRRSYPQRRTEFARPDRDS